MSGAITHFQLIPVVAKSSWATAAEAWEDIRNQLEDTFGLEFPINHALTMCLYALHSDTAQLTVTAAGVASYALTFTSAPVTGDTVFIFDFWLT